MFSINLHYNKDLYDVQELIKNGADVNHKDSDGNTPLHNVLLKCIAEYLISKGADVNSRNNKGETPLHTKSLYYESDICQYLIDNGADIDTKDNFGNTPLHLSVLYHEMKTITCLIRNNADINSRNNLGNTPIFNALDNANTVKYLLESGADPKIVNKDHNTILHEAVKYNLESTKAIFSEEQVNYQNKYGYTPLFYALWYNNLDIFEYLIDNRGNINIQDNKGKTLLHYAFQDNNLNAIKYLFKFGAKISVKDNFGKKPFDY